jgi:hypothetical protein
VHENISLRNCLFALKGTSTKMPPPESGHWLIMVYSGGSHGGMGREEQLTLRNQPEQLVVTRPRSQPALGHRKRETVRVPAFDPAAFLTTVGAGLSS